MSKGPLTLSSDELRRLIELAVLTTAPDDATPDHIAGIALEQQATIRHLIPDPRTQAAVLMPLVLREQGLSLLFTQRAAHLRNHAGQISFPGGRIEAGDAGPMAAALRETEEEIGLVREHVRVVGYLPPHLVFTGFRITPVVAFVQPGFELQLDAREVAEVFEVPFRHFLDPLNHLQRERLMGEVTLKIYDFPFGERRIWGATAGIIMSLYRRLSQHWSQ